MVSFVSILSGNERSILGQYTHILETFLHFFSICLMISLINVRLRGPTKPWTVDDNGAVDDDENEIDTVSPTSKPQLADDGSERSILAVIDTFDCSYTW